MKVVSVKSLIVDRTHLALVSGKLVLQIKFDYRVFIASVFIDSKSRIS